jgi:phage shock protein E
MKVLTFLILFLAITLSSFTMAESRSTVTQAQLTSLKAAPSSPKYTLLDVRSTEEYQAGHISGAVNVSHSELSDKLSFLTQDKSEMIVVYCRSGRRAGIAEQILKDNGYTNVRHLAGDMKGWEESNLPVVTK